jgi:hypothetical protein
MLFVSNEQPKPEEVPTTQLTPHNRHFEVVDARNTNLGDVAAVSKKSPTNHSLITRKMVNKQIQSISNS